MVKVEKGAQVTKRVVVRRPQRAGWADGGIKKLISETATNRAEKWFNLICLEMISDSET